MGWIGKFLLLVWLAGSAFANASESWIEAEYLRWWIKKNPLPPPLLTSANEMDPLPGAIGQPNTRVVLGNGHVHMGAINGFQVGAGSWIRKKYGIGASFFLLPTVSKSKTFSTSGEPGSPNFAVPIFDVMGVFGLGGVPGETIFILPGPLFGGPGFSGVFKLRISSRFQGAELNGLFRWSRCDFELKGIAGFRWLQLEESLIFKGITGTVPNFPFPAGFYDFSDRFHTENNFLGAQVGICPRYQKNKWHIEGIFKGGLGAVLEQLKIHGSSKTSGGNLFLETMGTAGTVLPGGIFAEPSNIGKSKKTEFACEFEAQVRSGYRVAKHLEIDLGYTFLLISKVLRPGDQIDRKINTTRTALADASRTTVGIGPGPIPFGEPEAAPAARGPKRPKTLFKTSTFWAQGLDVGIQIPF